MGVAIDILVGLFLVWSLWRGWHHGLLYQIGQLALMVVGYFLARGLGSLAADPLAGTGMSRVLAGSIGFFAVFFLVVFIGSFFVRKITRDLRDSSRGLSQTDRSLGVVVGGAKGAFYAYVIIVALIMGHRMTGKIPIPFHSSVSGRWVLANNFLDSDEFPRFKALAKIGLLIHSRDLQDLGDDPNARAILEHPKADALKSPEVLAAIESRDFVALLNNDALMDFLDEPEIQAHLNQIDVLANADSSAPSSP